MTEIEELKAAISELTAQVKILSIKVSPAVESSVTLKEWLDKWLDAYKRPKVKPLTYRDYCALVKNYIIPTLGEKKLIDLSSVDIQSFFASMTNSRTRQLLKTILSAALKKAVNAGYLLKNVCADIELKSYQRTTRKAFTLKEEKRFLKAIQNSYYRVNFLVYLYTGIRKAEIKRLRFDYAKRFVYVDGTKTKAAVRVVPLAEPLISELKAYFAAGRDLGKNNKNMSNEFQSVCRRAGLRGFCLHSLRHTFATRCLENGVPLKVLQGWLGHSTFEVTADIYSHVTPDYSKKEAKKILKIVPEIGPKAPLKK